MIWTVDLRFEASSEKEALRMRELVAQLLEELDEFALFGPYEVAPIEKTMEMLDE